MALPHVHRLRCIDAVGLCRIRSLRPYSSADIEPCMLIRPLHEEANNSLVEKRNIPHVVPWQDWGYKPGLLALLCRENRGGSDLHDDQHRGTGGAEHRGPRF